MVQRVPGWTQRLPSALGGCLAFAIRSMCCLCRLGQSGSGWGQIAPPDRPALPIDDFGDGARAVFKVLAPLIALSEQVTDDEPGVFLWEEPEPESGDARSTVI